MSSRLTTFLLGLLAAGLAVVARLSGIFHSWDLGLFEWLDLPTQHPVFPVGIDLACTVLFAFGTVLIARQVTSSKARWGLLVVTLLQPVSAVSVGLVAGWGISPFAWMTGILAGVLGVGLHQISATGKRERLLREIFGTNLSPVALEKLATQPEALDSRSVCATVLQARFVGSDWSLGEAFATRLRDSLAWVELQSGSRLQAVWNAPVLLGSPAHEAIREVLANTGDWHAGVSTGEILAGRVEDTDTWRMSGEVFDNAAALCQANAVYGSRVLIDLTTSDAVGEDFVMRPVDLFIQPGSEMGMEIFEPLASREEAGEEALARRDHFWNAVIFFRQKRYSESIESFKKAGVDPVVEYWLKRLEKINPV